MLQREAAWLPPWRELLRVLRRLEARGDIRGGRFVAGVIRRAVRVAGGGRRMLRETRRAAACRRAVSRQRRRSAESRRQRAAPAPKVPALTGNRILYRDGVPVAALVAGEIQWIETLGTAEARAAERC